MENFKYQWHANAEEIKGANDEKYTLTEKDVNKKISVKVTYTDIQGQNHSFTSNSTEEIFTSSLNNQSEYQDAGFNNVDEYNINAIKTVVIPGEMNKEQIEKIITSYTKIINYSYSSDDEKPQAEDYIALGIVNFDESNLDLLNDAITLIEADLVENIETLKKAANAVDHILNKPDELTLYHFKDLQYDTTKYIVPKLQKKIANYVKPLTEYDQIEKLISETIRQSGVQMLIVSSQASMPSKFNLDIGPWIEKTFKELDYQDYSPIEMKVNGQDKNLENLEDNFEKYTNITLEASVIDIEITSKENNCTQNDSRFEHEIKDLKNKGKDADKTYTPSTEECLGKKIILKIRKPETLITSGSKLKIELKVKNKDEEVLEDFNDKIHVKINHLAYDDFICGEDEDNYCKKATLSSSNKLITCKKDGMSCHVNAKNGIANFQDLILNGQINKIYNLEFYYEGISSLDLSSDKKRLDPKSSTNHLSQVLIYDGDENDNQIYSYETEIKVGDINHLIFDEKSTAKITVEIYDQDKELVTDKKVRLETDTGTFEKNSPRIEINNHQDGVYSATLTISNDAEEAYVDLFVGDVFLKQIKINFQEQTLHSFNVENYTCQKLDNKDSNICFISLDKEQETLRIRLRDQDNKLIPNKTYSIEVNGAATDVITDRNGIYEYTWNINETDNKEIKFYHDNIELIIAPLNKPKWGNLNNCFDFNSDYDSSYDSSYGKRKYITLEVEKTLGNHTNPTDDVAINFSVDTGSITQPNNRFGHNTEINIKCVLGDMPDETGENSNEIIWQISKEDYEKKWPNMPQITASITIQELKFEVKVFVPITKTIFLDWPINQVINIAFDTDKKITVGVTQNGLTYIDKNVLYYLPDDEKAHKAMLEDSSPYNNTLVNNFYPDLFDYNLYDTELFDRLPISITSDDESKINTYLHIKFAPDISYKYQDYFKEFISENPITHHTGINLHKAIISERADGKANKGYSGDGIKVAIAGDSIFHHQELDEIIKLDLIELNTLNKGIAKQQNQSEKFANNTNIAGIIASQVNDPSYGKINIRGISPNVDLVNIAIVDTSFFIHDYTQEADRINVIKLLSDTDNDTSALGLSPNHEYQKISNETNKYSPYKSIKTSEINILNLNFTLSKSIDYDYSDKSIENYIWDATSRKYNIHLDNEKELYKTKLGNTIFIKGLDFYTEKKSALISNHPAIINVESYYFNDLGDKPTIPVTTNFKSKANWISVPINHVMSICYVIDDIHCKNQNTTKFPDRYQSGYVGIFGNSIASTSIASAIVTGVIALMLEANPELTWRDIKYILANTAKVGDIENMIENKAGYKFDVKNNYGFGIIDAEAAVKMASTYEKELGDLQVIKTLSQRSTDALEVEGTGKIVFTIDEDINIEAITLTYNVKFIQPDMSFKNLTMSVDHPLSKIFKLITIPSYPREDNDLKITFNNFYGESAMGEWMFHFLYEQDTEFIDYIEMEMTIYGTKEVISKTANP